MHRTIAAVTFCLGLACGASGDPAAPTGPESGGGVVVQPPGSGGAASCLGSQLLGSLGKDHLLVGLSGSDASAGAAPYDLRYLYISGGIPEGSGPCASCDLACTATNHSNDPPSLSSCDNAHGCVWWGCWQWDQVAPGDYARGFIATAKAAKSGPQIPMFTYYELLQSMPGVTWKGNEGDSEVKQVSDVAFMSRYYTDWRFLLKQVGTEVVLLHVEPDFWGYAAQRGVACSSIPAAAASANATDCGALPNTLAGMGQCMIAMARKYAPNARVGLHASGWGTMFDVLNNSDPSLDASAHGAKLGQFLAGCGAGGGDFVGADMSDRDADYYRIVKGQDQHWWDVANATLPSFHQAFSWSKAVAEAVGKPVLWWQTPLGNAAMPNKTYQDAQGGTLGQWKDNKLDYAFGHMSELAGSHAVGIAFGAGQGDQTTPDNDDGDLQGKARAYAAAGGQRPCL
jgi:hypothetical protein